MILICLSQNTFRLNSINRLTLQSKFGAGLSLPGKNSVPFQNFCLDIEVERILLHPHSFIQFVRQRGVPILEMVPLKNRVLNCIMLHLLLRSYLSSAHDSVGGSATTKVAEDVELVDHRYILKNIFVKYGDGDRMTFEGFEHLLGSLGLGNVIFKDHDVEDHKESNAFKDTHDSHEHSQTDQPHNERKRASKDSHKHVSLPLPNHMKQSTSVMPSGSSKPARGHDDHSHPHHHHDYHEPTVKPIPHFPELLDNITSMVERHRELSVKDPESALKQCLSPLEMFMVYDMDLNKTLDPSNFIHLCPAIVWELEGGHCLTHSHHSDGDILSVTLHQWLYSCLAVLIISLCGLFSVAVVPIMQKWFYHTLLQYLVGLAIGSLSGDAMLHLMPHALKQQGGGHSHGTEEGAGVWRGMAALGGIYFFFIAERCLNSLTVYKTKRKAKKSSLTSKLRTETLLATGNLETNEIAREKLSEYRQSNGDQNGPHSKEMQHMLPQPVDAADSALGCNEASRKNSNHSIHEVGFHGRSSFSAEPNVYYHQTSPSESYVVTVADHHGHGHGHSHEVPKSISAVAWMVIMGDGLHNFCDGLAIGTAFAAGIPGGISTAVAVFCHELPHELGDFAMLLKTGMKVKQALLYNGMSSVLCFIGMVIGVSLGNVASATTWVFAITAGMFMYIALVDMLPELSAPSNDLGSTTAHQLAVQVLGISTGISIMLIIAVYEHDLESLVS